MIKIRPFEPGEWRAYRDIRIRALQEAPHAFGSTYEQALGFTDVAWRARLADLDPAYQYPLGAFLDDQVVGLAWGAIQPADKDRADLYQMWCSPDVRGQGVGRRLLEGVLDWARQQGAVQIVLSVTVGNDAAEQLYLSAGFKPFGDLEPLRPGSPKMVRNMQLSLLAG